MRNVFFMYALVKRKVDFTTLIKKKVISKESLQSFLNGTMQLDVSDAMRISDFLDLTKEEINSIFL